MKTLQIISALTRKCITILYRQPSVFRLALFSYFIVFGTFYLTWLSCRTQKLHYLTNNPYSPLSFDYKCSPKNLADLDHSNADPSIRRESSSSNLKCYPFNSNSPTNSKELTPSEILFNILITGNMFGDTSDDQSKRKPTSSLANLLSSLMLNGLPLLGMSDFIKLSDIVNNYIGKSGKSKLMEYEAYRERFGNFLNIRQKHLRIVSNIPCLGNQFAVHMENIEGLNVKLFSTMKEAQTICCQEVFAIVDISVPQGLEENFNNIKLCTESNETTFNLDVTIRMHPSMIADSRTKIWTPRINTIQRYQTGQLLYMISGFLSLQFEIQNFLSLKHFGGTYIDSKVLDNPNTLSNHEKYTQSVAYAISDSLIGPKQDIETIVEIINNHPKDRDTISVPIYLRAFPTHSYEQIAFWHTFGPILTVIIIVLFSLPASVTGGAYRKELTGGHIDVLSTFPMLRQHHSAISWVLCGMAWVTISTIISLVFFKSVLIHSNSLVPSFALMLCGWSMGPLSIILGLFLQRQEEMSLALPSLVFLLLLPGMLYVDLAFDVQRSFWMEFIICLLPPSAATLTLRHVFGNEALNIGVSWSFPAPISKTPPYTYLIILILDNLILGLLALILVNYFEPIKNKYNMTHPKSISDGSIEFLVNRTALAIERCLSWIFQKFESMYNTIYYEASNREGYNVLSPSVSYESMNDIELREPRLLRSYNEPIYLISPNQPIKENSTENNFSQLAISIDSIRKYYRTNGSIVEILSNISTNLNFGTIYTLLGSNGAGKTSFLRILCGLDSYFSGSIALQESNVDITRGRNIGWCPQSDPIYDYFTVEEHLKLLGALIDISNSSMNAEFRSDSQITNLMNELDILSFRHKLGHELSGGMKRRLSLAMAFIGNPKILLLDEPTSGCDSRNRELVHIAILGRKVASSVLVSTHHIDDIEILSDRILFLNERHLVYDGLYCDLFLPDEYVPRGSVNQNKISENPLIFSSSDSIIISEFTKILAECSTLIGPHFRYQVSKDGYHLLREFIKSLEERSMFNWSLTSPSLNYCLDKLYEKSHMRSNLRYSMLREYEGQQWNENLYAKENPTITSVDPNLVENTESSVWTHLNDACLQFMGHFRSIINVRLLEVRSHLPSYVISTIFVPFLIVLIICIGCCDVKYPKIELSSGIMEGKGEIPIGVGDKIDRDQLNKYFNDTNNKYWVGDIISNSLWKELFNDYYIHKENRWSAYVVKDQVPDWIETSITLDDRDFPISKVNMSTLFSNMVNAKDRICFRNNTDLDNGVMKSNDLTHNNALEDITFGPANAQNTILFCSSVNPAISISLVEKEYEPSEQQFSEFKDPHLLGRDRNISHQIVIRSYLGLSSNLTFLTNITAPHAAPIFLKEETPKIYSNLVFVKNSTSLDYRLYSHPLPVFNLSNEIYIERGYVGSVLIVFYMLILSIKAIRMTVYIRSTHVKTLLHTKGLQCLGYWLPNLLFDVLISFTSYLSIGLGLTIGGNPVASYFLNFNEITGIYFLFTCFLFSIAIIVSSYAWTTFSTDQLSSQLFLLLSTICDGIFFKLFFDRHKGLHWDYLSNLLIYLSPAYAGSTCFFEMFRWHALKVTMLSAGSVLEQDLKKSTTIVTICLLSMICQSFGYLALTILIDRWAINFVFIWLKLNSIVRLYSQTLMTLCTKKMQWSDDKEKVSMYSTSNPQSRGEKAHILLDSMGEGVIRHLSLNGKIGIFPAGESHDCYGNRNRSSLEDDSLILRSNISFNTDESSDIAVAVEMSTGNKQNLDCKTAINNLFVEYPSSSNFEHYALKNITFTMAAGEHVALMGSSGGGKSTLFKTLGFSEIIQTGGRVRIDGADTIDNHWLISKKQSLGYVPQEKGLLEFLTVQDSLELFFNISKYSKGNTNQSFSDYLSECVVDDQDYLSSAATLFPSIGKIGIISKKYLNYPVYTLSGGNKKKLALLQSQLGSPNVLLLDEVTSGVDPLSADRIIQYLRSRTNKMNSQSILFASHRIDECYLLCNRVLIITHGRLIFDGSIESFRLLASAFYQCDITTDINQQDIAQQCINDMCKRQGHSVDRVVIYCPTLFRVTFERNYFPISMVWDFLEYLKNSMTIEKYSIREMGMEDALTSILATYSSNELTSIEQQLN